MSLPSQHAVTVTFGAPATRAICRAASKCDWEPTGEPGGIVSEALQHAATTGHAVELTEIRTSVMRAEQHATAAR